MSAEAENLMGDILEQEADDPNYALRLQLLEYKELEDSLPSDLKPDEDDLEARLALLRDIAGQQYMMQQEEGIQALISASEIPQMEEQTNDDDQDEDIMTRARFVELLRQAHEAGLGVAFLNEHFNSEQITPEVDVDTMSYEDLLELGDRIGKVNVGLTPEKIEAFTTRKTCLTDSDETCTICCTEFAAGDVLRKLTCPHVFHADCVDQWLSESKKCPLCKTEVVEKQISEQIITPEPEQDEPMEVVSEEPAALEMGSPIRTPPARKIRKIRKNKSRPATAAEVRNNALLLR